MGKRRFQGISLRRDTEIREIRNEKCFRQNYEDVRSVGLIAQKADGILISRMKKRSVSNMNILVIGGGGREHAICKALKKSARVEKLYCLPGNAGIEEIAICDRYIAATDFEAIKAFIQKCGDIDMCVVAPDDPLALGLVDELDAMGIPCFGPKKDAAVIESSKAFSKNLMKKYDIPTAEFAVFDVEDAAIRYIKKQSNYPVVVKADGLALGKGVLICEDESSAIRAVHEIMGVKTFGDAGKRVVIEAFLKGREVSVLTFTDGETVVPMLASQDHKRALDGDRGLNTGGMGAFCPSPFYTDALAETAMQTIFLPTIRAMKSEGRKFKGVLYFGLMMTESGLKVLEYNARFGDPETQVVLPMLKTDLTEIMSAVIEERLGSVHIEWEKGACACVVMASGGYPLKYEKNKEITVGELPSGSEIYHSGTRRDNGKLFTNGGRVLCVSAKGKTLKEAVDTAYKGVRNVRFEGAHFRNDIGKGLK